MIPRLFAFRRGWTQTRPDALVALDLSRLLEACSMTSVGKGRQKTDGVPLFVEEMTKAVLGSSVLRAEGDRYALTGLLSEVSIPASLHESLMARLDRYGENACKYSAAAHDGLRVSPLHLQTLPRTAWTRVRSKTSKA
jgi:hypothetical protein